MADTTFPVYRKYRNDMSYFKIISEESFEEVKKLPTGYALFNFKAKILPDRNYIQDMLYDYHLHWQVISKEDYEKVKAMIPTQ